MNILHQARDAFQLARGVEFESGMDYPFYHAINELIVKYKGDALPSIRRILNNHADPYTIHFTLRHIGKIENQDSLYARLAFIAAYLSHKSAIARDGAALGLANLDHPAAIYSLKKAISVEPVSDLKQDMIQVLNQLERTLCKTNQP